MKPTLPRSAALATVTALAFAACSGPLPTEAPNTPVRPSTGSVLSAQTQGSALSAAAAAQRIATARQPRPLGLFNAHFDHRTGRVTFEPAEQGGPSGGRPLGGYIATNTNTFSLEDNGTTIIGPGTFSGGSCAANQVCAQVTVTNDGSRQIDNIRVEINSMNGGATLANGNPVGTGYPSTAGNVGGWNYGPIAGGGNSAAPWVFNTAGGADFDFQVTVWGTYTRTGYTASPRAAITATNNTTAGNAAWSDSAPAWRDACLTGTVLSALPSYITVPFPFSFYDTTIDPDTWPDSVEVTAFGTLSLTGVPDGNNLGLTNASTADYTLFPFWDNLDTSTGQVCTGLDSTSAAPNRRFVITWKDVRASSALPNSRLTFSIVMQEATDKVWFLYHKWSTVNSPSSCTSSGTGSSEVQGGSASIGVRGNGSAQSTVISVNTAALGLHPIPCPGAGAYYTLTAAPANP